MAKIKRERGFKRRQYKLNWAQILNRLEEAYQAAMEESPPKLVIVNPLDEAIEALRDRMGLPADTHRKKWG